MRDQLVSRDYLQVVYPAMYNVCRWDEFEVIFSKIKGGDMYGKKSITGGN